MKKLLLLPVLLFLVFNSLGWCESGFTQKDRELLIELRTKMMEIDKRFAELREDMNKRFEQVDKRFAELREDMNKRFEQVDKRFGEMMSFIGILAAIFAAMTIGTIGFAFWDRKTMIRPFETKVAELDKRITANREKYENLIPVLKEYASKNKKFADIIKQFNIF
jgi:DNA repair exonuclease SbcCD ATPase subunit